MQAGWTPAEEGSNSHNSQQVDQVDQTTSSLSMTHSKTKTSEDRDEESNSSSYSRLSFGHLLSQDSQANSLQSSDTSQLSATRQDTRTLGNKNKTAGNQ